MLLVVIEIDGFGFLKRFLFRLINNTFVLYDLKHTNIIVVVKVFNLYGQQWFELLFLWLSDIILFRELYRSGCFLLFIVIISFIESQVITDSLKLEGMRIEYLLRTHILLGYYILLLFNV